MGETIFHRHDLNSVLGPFLLQKTFEVIRDIFISVFRVPFLLQVFIAIVTATGTVAVFSSCTFLLIFYAGSEFLEFFLVLASHLNQSLLNQFLKIPFATA